MGYTHYWHQSRDATVAEWAQIQTDVAEILAHVEQRAEVKLANGMGDRGTKPEIDRDMIRFNGSGDEAYETFAVERKRGEDSRWFCKTSREPYDLAVTAVLCYLSAFHLMGEIDEVRKPLVHVTSDGKGKDFLAGLDIAKIALPHLGNVLDLPMGVMEEDRWVAPWVDRYGKSYSFKFCVDGHAYVIRVKDGEAFRFHTHHLAALWASQHKEKAMVVDNCFGRSYEGGASLFQPSGSFHEKRHKAIARQQTVVFKKLFDPLYAEAGTFAKYGELGHKPPAYARPGEILAVPKMLGYYLKDLLEEAKAA